MPGGVTQVKEVAAALIRVAKTRNITTVLVGHVTKDGSIAGPRVLEHVVDVVLHFEGDRNSRFRMVRAMKNRFGPIDEVGCFDLSAEGITAVTDPTGLFVENHHAQVAGHLRRGDDGGPPAAAGRGAGAWSRPPRPSDRGARPRGWTARGSRWSSPCSSSTAASGCTPTTSSPPPSAAPGCSEPASDLAVAVALASATTGTAAPQGVVAMGEIGLAGELRRVRDLPQRIAEAARLGFRVAVVPERARHARPPGRPRVVDRRRHAGARRPRHRLRPAAAAADRDRAERRTS